MVSKALDIFEQLEVDYVLYHYTPTGIMEKGTSTVSHPEGSSQPTVSEDERLAAEILNKKYEKDNKMVRGNLLNHISNTLFDVFFNKKSSKSIWEILDKKYGSDDTDKKKYVVGRWINFKMKDDKLIMDRVHEYENIVTKKLS